MRIRPHLVWTAALVLSALPAAGQSPNAFGGPERVPPRSGNRHPAAECQQLCDTDMSPCDPVQFKTADGRCSNPVASSTH